MKVVVLTGAGISAESGIRTFRASDGLWEDHRLEDVASPEGFTRNPDLVYRFYNERRRQIQLPEVTPNAGHMALAELEQRLGDDFLLVTQNVDNLHERAGNKNVLHMHGELLKTRCNSCQVVSDFIDPFDGQTDCPSCKMVGHLRPHIVWFGEMPFYMDEIYHALSNCDVFAAIGTSGNVYPAAGFVDIALECGAKTYEINLEQSQSYNMFEHGVYGPATQAVPRWIKEAGL